LNIYFLLSDKAPTLKTIKVRKVTVGRKLQISCRIRTARPAPKMLWEKNGQILVDGKDGYKIRKTK
jgi:tRNA-binding EMAP/Myf-like protein